MCNAVSSARTPPSMPQNWARYCRSYPVWLSEVGQTIQPRRRKTASAPGLGCRSSCLAMAAGATGRRSSSAPTSKVSQPLRREELWLRSVAGVAAAAVVKRKYEAEHIGASLFCRTHGSTLQTRKTGSIGADRHPNHRDAMLTLGCVYASQTPPDYERSGQ